MRKNFVLIIILFVSFSINGFAQTKNIVITEDTYKKLTATGVNHVKMAKNADKRKGIIIIKDSPHERYAFDNLRTQNPTTKELPADYRNRELQFMIDNRNNLKSSSLLSRIAWKQAGPYNVGGRTRAIAIDVTDNQVILAGGVSGGMWRSENGGQSWTKTTVPNEHQSVTAVAQDPRDGHTNIWYYATGELYGNSGSASGAFYLGAGVYKSVDRGKSWAKFADTDRFDTPFFNELFDICWNVSVDPTNGDLYVATYGGIYKYNFGEETRNYVLNSIPNNDEKYRRAYVTDILCTPLGIKYATLSDEGEIKGIYRSESGNADEWVDITPETFPENFKRTVLAYAPSNENILYFLSETPGNGINDHSLWKLIMNGDEAVWENRSGNLPAKESGSDSDVSGYTSQNSYDMVIKVAPDDENMVFIGGTNLYRSDNGFATKDQSYWIGGYATENDVSLYVNQHADQHSLVFLKDGKTLISGHDGGISKTIDYKKKDTDTTPVDWISLNNGYLTTQAYTVGVDPVSMESFEIMSGFQDNGSWYTNQKESGVFNKNWLQVGSGDGGFCSIHNSKNAYVFSSQIGITYLVEYSDDNEIWSRIDPVGADIDSRLFINPYEINPNNESIMYFAGGTDIWRNKNIYSIPKFENEAASVGWEKINSSKVIGQISCIKSSFSPSNILYYGTSQGKIYKIENANTGQPNTSDITGLNMPYGYVTSIDVNPMDANEILVAFSNYEIESIFQSKDGGASWAAVSGNLEISNSSGSNIGPSVRYVSSLNIKKGTIYFAATSIGLYSAMELSEDTHWTQESTDMIGSTIVNMVKTRMDGFVVVGSHGNGIFTTKLRTALNNVTSSENGINANAEKIGIYPNPMIDKSRIEFPNENNNSCRLVVIDASGRVVRIIENVTNNNVTINREQLKPGIHIITVEGEKMYIGKLLVK